MTYDKLLNSSVSVEKIPDIKELTEHNKIQALPKRINPVTTKSQNTHKRSQSYNFEFKVNKSKYNVNISSSSNNAPANKNNTNKRPDLIRNKTVRLEPKNVLEEAPLMQAFVTYFCYTVLRWFGNLREFLYYTGLAKPKGAKDNNSKEFTPLYSDFEGFFIQHFYVRGRDCFNRPICGVPGAEIELVDRKTDDFNWSFYNTGTTSKCLNMGSYNYLGFAENQGKCTDSVKETIRTNSIATCSPRQELGTTSQQLELENLIAKFLNKEKALVFGMGFATNAVNIPALVDKNCLIMSDELNHTSLILGSRLSGAVVKTFKHNQPEDLEKKLRAAIIEGHPLTRRPWKKVLIVVEGIYSMEGTILNLPAIIAIKKKYKAYLYLDEAHSIGALGLTGRGICEYWGVDTEHVDVLMGTFSKSFGASGGYVAGSNRIVNYLKMKSHAQSYASSMSPAICDQVHKALQIIMDIEGKNRIRVLKENSVYFRDKLVKMGFIVYGDTHSPIVPVMFYVPSKCLYFNRLMLECGIAVVSVGFPATSLIGGRVRFCMSAAHTKGMLDKALRAIDYCGGVGTNSKMSRLNPERTMDEIEQLEKNTNSN